MIGWILLVGVAAFGLLGWLAWGNARALRAGPRVDDEARAA